MKQGELNRMIQEDYPMVEQCVRMLDIPSTMWDDALHDAYWGFFEFLQERDYDESDEFKQFAYKRMLAKIAEMVNLPKTAVRILEYEGKVESREFKHYLIKISAAYKHAIGKNVEELATGDEDVMTESEFLNDIFARCHYEDMVNYILNFTEGVKRDILLSIFSGEEKENTLFRMKAVASEEEYEKTKEWFLRLIKEEPMELRFGEYKVLFLAEASQYIFAFCTGKIRELLAMFQCYKSKNPNLYMDVRHIDGIVKVTMDPNITALEHIMLIMRSLDIAKIELIPIDRQFYLDRI